MAAASRRRLFLHSLATIRLPNVARSTATPRNLETSTLESAATVEPSDEALISLVCQGNTEAVGLLFRRYARVVHSVAYRVLRDASEADDLLQDVFVLIHRLCRTFDSSKGSAQFWILQMAYRRATSQRRYLNSRHFYRQVELVSNHPRWGNPDVGIPTIQLTQSWLNWNCKRCSEPYRKTSSKPFDCISSRATPWMRLRRCLAGPKAMSVTTPSVDWNGCESRFLVANCRAREQAV